MSRFERGGTSTFVESQPDSDDDAASDEADGDDTPVSNLSERLAEEMRKLLRRTSGSQIDIGGDDGIAIDDATRLKKFTGDDAAGNKQQGRRRTLFLLAVLLVCVVTLGVLVALNKHNQDKVDDGTGSSSSNNSDSALTGETEAVPSAPLGKALEPKRRSSTGIGGA